MRTQLTLASVGALVEGTHPQVGEVLGPHRILDEGRELLAVRAFMPHAERAWVVHAAHSGRQPMRKIHPAGVFEAICPPDYLQHHARYQIQMASDSGELTTVDDPYAFPSLLTDYDLFLVGEGSHIRCYEKFGAQLREVDGTCGVNFAVWAPNAQHVSLVGDFNHWDGRKHQMRNLGNCGVWELFVPGLKAGEHYKFRVKTLQGEIIDKSDPFGFAAELPPRTASIVTDLSQHQWQDDAWMKRRAKTDWLQKPISVYEVHLGSWKVGGESEHGWLNYRDLAHELVAYCQEFGFTHLELLPVSEHPFSGSWGYQTVGYFAATSRHGTPEDFMYFVDYCHQNDIGVIIDWVPAHFPKDGHGLRRFDGSALYEHEDPRQGEHPDWGTLIFNYGRNEVRNFLIANAIFWFDKYHIDGLRVDAVASMLYLDYSREEGDWLPNRFGGRENLEAIDFLKKFNETSHAEYPGVLTIAEESTAWDGVSKPTYVGGLGFSLKWNMGWMNDTLRYMKHEPIHRQYHHDELTFSLIYAFSENFTLPLSHDEVVHGKGSLADQMPGDLWQRFANLRLLYSYMWCHPGKKLLFMGSEFGQWSEWRHDESLQWDLLQWETHHGVQRMLGDLNRIYTSEPALYENEFDGSGFEWIDCENRGDSVLIWMRKAKRAEDFVIICCNFTPVVRDNYLVGVPEGGVYQELFNSDSQYYGGSNAGNLTKLTASQPGHHSRPYKLSIKLPPLGCVILKPTK